MLLLPLSLLINCSSQTETIANAESEDGRFIARIERVSFGGAAGGVSFCLTVSEPDERDSRCRVLGVRFSNPTIQWSDSTLTMHTNGGEITRQARRGCIYQEDERFCFNIVILQS